MEKKNTYHIKNSRGYDYNWWVKGFVPQVSLVLEIIEEEIEDTEFFFQENKNNLTYNLEYCT
tara:strand:+ start:93 stop:278 length:186 start_codon:yes stop_codon:yes gene_type:complete